MKYLTIIITIVVILGSCNSSNEKGRENREQKLEEMMGNMHPQSKEHAAVVLEYEDAGSYTYVKLKGSGDEFWAAITARPVTIGKTYYYTPGMMMRDFDSKQLGKTFDSVMFIQEFSEDQILKQMGEKEVPGPAERTKSAEIKNISVDPPEGGISIGEIYANQEQYAGKMVKVRGQVVKVNSNIMQRHWVHIQDGTEHDGNYDLTITTTIPVNFKVGDIITFEGIISLDKDFGAGYRYDVIMEDAATAKTRV